MKEYMITFGTELSEEQLDVIEKKCNIPTKIGTVFVNARSAWHAMKIFKKKYNIKRMILPTKNLLKYVYIVRPITRDSYVLFRVIGLRWSEDYTTLVNSL